MVLDGVDYPPGRDGKFRCPWLCHDPEWPAPKWSTEKGYQKHLEKCLQNPKKAYVSPKEERRIFGECRDCGIPIMTMSSMWKLANAVVCMGCCQAYYEAGMGYHDCAGLELPGLMLEG